MSTPPNPPETTPVAEGPVGCPGCGDTAGPFDLTTGLCEDCLDGAK